MPVWHEKTREWVEEGRLQLVGIIQEQHPERCRLLAQWQQFDWPILHDPINVIGATAVPMFIAIDEHGIVRATRPRIDSFEESFLNQTFDDDATNEPAELTPPHEATQFASLDPRDRGDALYLWHRDRRLDEAIAAYQQAIDGDSADSERDQFRMGVCLLHRFERERKASNFQQAVGSWESALSARPNQYIWRRRIQQYGPRLSKPYPFYDWIAQAENSIRSRGETPVRLAIRPSGAEIATPSRRFIGGSSESKSPDPLGKIHRDKLSLIQASVATVPSKPSPGDTIRLHITLTPNPALKVHWNNDAAPVQVWLDPSEQVQFERNLIEGVNPPEAETNELRRFDLEVRIPESATRLTSIQLNGYALFYVCEDIGGVCQYLREDLVFDIPVHPQ